MKPLKNSSSFQVSHNRHLPVFNTPLKTPNPIVLLRRFQICSISIRRHWRYYWQTRSRRPYELLSLPFMEGIEKRSDSRLFYLVVARLHLHSATRHYTANAAEISEFRLGFRPPVFLLGLFNSF
ncbi:hypothetical protein HanRHA438_Chr16g0753261 [Helianthus annuus]|nr:hypothetical protein HanPSC8_Chr16g0710841 [Helianthus annuus]KAJ0835269.1 hypothetical protein HanRHA438_Chr16g0753261 [Helianthus annuus]